MSFSREDYLADGVKEDCDKLLEKFSHLQSYDFNDFLKVWKEMKFPFIYSNLEYYAELLEYTEEVFLIVKHLWINEKDFFRSVGAFYALIGVYQKQPTRNFVKIRLTIEDLKLIRIFLTTCIEKGLKQIILMYNEMKNSNAFIYVATERQYGLEYNFRKYFASTPEFVPIEKDSHLEHLGNELPEALCNYLEAKKNLLDTNKNLSSRLNFLKSDKIEEVVQNLSQTITIHNEDMYRQIEDVNQGEARKRIKNRAFCGGILANTGSEAEDVEDNEKIEVETDDEKKPTSKKRFWRSKLKYSNTINLKGKPNPESDKNIVLDSFIKNQLNENYCEENGFENEEKYVEELMMDGKRPSKGKLTASKAKRLAAELEEGEGEEEEEKPIKIKKEKMKRKKRNRKNTCDMEVASTSTSQLKLELSSSSSNTSPLHWRTFPNLEEFNSSE